MPSNVIGAGRKNNKSTDQNSLLSCLYTNRVIYTILIQYVKYIVYQITRSVIERNKISKLNRASVYMCVMCNFLKGLEDFTEKGHLNKHLKEMNYKKKKNQSCN